MWDERSFDLRSFSNTSWLFAQSYGDLSGAERIYVRSLLESVFVREMAEQIVSCAATLRLSVFDAIETLVVRGETVVLVISDHEARRAIAEPAPLAPVAAALPQRVVDEEGRLAAVFVRREVSVLFASSEPSCAVFTDYEATVQLTCVAVPARFFVAIRPSQEVVS